MLVDQCLCYVEFDKDGKCLWVLVEIDEVLVQIEVGVELEGMVVSSDGKWVVNISEIINMLYWIDISIQ